MCATNDPSGIATSKCFPALDRPRVGLCFSTPVSSGKLAEKSICRTLSRRVAAPFFAQHSENCLVNCSFGAGSQFPDPPADWEAVRRRRRPASVGSVIATVDRRATAALRSSFRVLQCDLICWSFFFALVDRRAAAALRPNFRVLLFDLTL